MKYALVYGGMAGTIVICVITASIAFSMPSHATSVWFGYLIMLVALSLIFAGVKRYRDVECGGVINFGRALGLGVAIAAVAGLVHVLGWELYLAVSGRDYIADHSALTVQDMRSSGASPAAIQAKIAEMQAMALYYGNPLFRIPITFIEIFPVGLLVALVSAALLPLK